jgi:hypothetical protein
MKLQLKKPFLFVTKCSLTLQNFGLVYHRCLLFRYLPFTSTSTLILYIFHPSQFGGFLTSTLRLSLKNFPICPCSEHYHHVPQVLCLSISYLLSRSWGWLSQYSNGLWAGSPGFDSQQGQRHCVLHSIQSASGTHPRSYPVGTGGCFPLAGKMVKWLGCEADHLHLVPRLRMLEL